MAVPFILGGIAIAAGLTGVGKGVNAAMKNSDAKGLNKQAQSMYDEAKERCDIARSETHEALGALGKRKAQVLAGSITSFVNAFSQLNNVVLDDSIGLNELKHFHIDEQTLTDMKELGGMAASLLGGAVGGVGAGALAAFGAYSGAMAFGAASTGTAIATLSGAAATNATLAFLGGGALSAGGFGIAGGTMVLGGIVAGPALAVLGFALDAKASKNLDEAHSNVAKSKKIVAELETVVTMCNGITERAIMFRKLLVKLDGVLKPLVSKMEIAIENLGTDFSQFDLESKKAVAMASATALAIKKVLDTPILDHEGVLTDESEIVAEETTTLLNSGKLAPQN